MNGKAPWQDWARGKGARVYGPSDDTGEVKGWWAAYVEDRPTAESGRESTILQLAEEISLDEIRGKRGWSEDDVGRKGVRVL